MSEEIRGQEINKSLEERVEDRVERISSGINEILAGLINRGCSEQDVAAFLGMHDSINDLLRCDYLGNNPELHGQYLKALLGGLRRLVEGLTTGNGSERRDEQQHIAKNPEKLSEAIAEALRGSNGSGNIGPVESRMVSDYKV